MRKLMLRSQSGRRYGPQLCAASAALLLLLLLLISLTVLHSRLSSSPFHLVLPHPHNSSSSSDPSPSDGRMIDQLDRLADEDDDEILESDQLKDLPRSPLSGFFWDHAAAVARRSFARNLPDPNNRNHLLPPPDAADIKTAFGSDDQPVDEGVRIKLDAIRHIEVALMLKTAGTSPLRGGWARWLEGKADFLAGRYLHAAAVKSGYQSPSSTPALPCMPNVRQDVRQNAPPRACLLELHDCWPLHV